MFNLVELKKSKRIRPKSDFEITKTGKVKKDKKVMSTAYEKKYSHKVVQNYSVDKKDRLHDKRGRFVSNKVKEKYDSLIEHSRKRTGKKLESKEPTTSRQVIKGRFMKSNYALTYECTCYIEEGITTHEDDKYGHVITHYYTISSPSLLTNSQARNRHDNHYPTHDIINIEHSSTKVLSFG